jgi:hypothetical protein
MKPKNIEEFKALVEIYENITLVKIKEIWHNESYFNVRNITGFGDISTCTLCRKVKATIVNYRCENCVYEISLGCLSFRNKVSYYRIINAQTPRQLLAAFRNRAKHLRKTYPQYL